MKLEIAIDDGAAAGTPDSPCEYTVEVESEDDQPESVADALWKQHSIRAQPDQRRRVDYDGTWVCIEPHGVAWMRIPEPSLVELIRRGDFKYNGHTWRLKSDVLGWKLWKDGALHWEYCVRAGVADDILTEIGFIQGRKA